MHAYRAYVIGPDGHIVHRVDLMVEDDEAAKERAKLLVDGRAVELWDRGLARSFTSASGIRT